MASLLSRAADAGGALLGRLQSVRLPGVGTASVKDDPATAARRWRAVTVLCDPDRLADPPAPLAALGGRIETRVTRAPGDKGTELAARYRGSASDAEIGELRAALREAKQLVEVGEVLRVEPQPHGPRAETPAGKALDGAAAAAPKEGVL
ncbi:hypothetical protein OF117_13275 [Geodermatophilus sp. YIM 151500]|uniref:hypothetical protein n=1 Tax=Geodermatophilus sp. YIM 151500 TaxID=2984531 RepID=UPI0021E482F2|nr:hypothetical protein [Geodermatophilus sp. YIM 151500]MCV2490334.1 hypothetical protein [Geodermatophilus sp. YIM 151500]